MKNKIIAALFCFLVFAGPAGATDESLEKVTNKVIDLYNEQKFNEALGVLDSIKGARNQYVNWYYYYALNKTRLGSYDDAVEAFDTYIKKSNINDTARAYYYLGLIQFYRGEYEKSLNSLQLSLDVSNDPKLDNMTDALIDKVIRYQSYYENTKKTNLTFLAGYGYDTNVINLAPSSFTENLNGHVFSYGASIAHKAVDKFNFTFEPTLAVIDSYTLDNSFKSVSTLQSTDALQLLLSLPIRFYLEDDKNPDKFDFSLNGYSVYLPLTGTTRELSLSSFFLQGQVSQYLSQRFSIKYHMVLAADKSYGFTSDDDDASGLRIEFLTTVAQALDTGRSLFYDFGIDYDTARGINTRYKKYSAAVGYMFPGFFGMRSAVRLGAHYLNYPDKATARTDNQGNLTYNLSKDLAGNSSLSLSVAAVSNSSNSDLNKYSDVNAAVQYTKTFGF